MTRQPVKSSAIASIGYDAEKQHLQVEFTSGKIYTYKNVPKEVHDEWMCATSIGKHYNDNIVGKYETL